LEGRLDEAEAAKGDDECAPVLHAGNQEDVIFPGGELGIARG